jgi:hypothetical protein
VDDWGGEHYSVILRVNGTIYFSGIFNTYHLGVRTNAKRKVYLNKTDLSNLKEDRFSG